jgi:hypothetical protein
VYGRFLEPIFNQFAILVSGTSVFKIPRIIMPQTTYSRLLQFLQEELSLPKASIAIAQRSAAQDCGPLPVVLWQYGLINLDELNQIYDWLEQA